MFLKWGGAGAFGWSFCHRQKNRIAHMCAIAKIGKEIVCLGRQKKDRDLFRANNWMDLSRLRRRRRRAVDVQQ